MTVLVSENETHLVPWSAGTSMAVLARIALFGCALLSPGCWPGPPVSSRRRWCSRKPDPGLAGQAKPQQISLRRPHHRRPQRAAAHLARQPRRTGRHRDQPRCRRAGATRRYALMSPAARGFFTTTAARPSSSKSRSSIRWPHRRSAGCVSRRSSRRSSCSPPYFKTKPVPRAAGDGPPQGSDGALAAQVGAHQAGARGRCCPRSDQAGCSQPAISSGSGCARAFHVFIDHQRRRARGRIGHDLVHLAHVLEIGGNAELPPPPRASAVRGADIWRNRFENPDQYERLPFDEVQRGNQQRDEAADPQRELSGGRAIHPGTVRSGRRPSRTVRPGRHRSRP